MKMASQAHVFGCLSLVLGHDTVTADSSPDVNPPDEIFSDGGTLSGKSCKAMYFGNSLVFLHYHAFHVMCTCHPMVTSQSHRHI